MRQLSRFGGGGDTLVTPLALVVAILAAVLILLLPRKYVVVPFLAACILIPQSEVIVIGGLHFMMLRIMVLAGWVRVIARGEFGKLISGLNSIDRIFLVFSIVSVATFTLLWGEWDAFVGRMGVFYNAIGIYFLLRILIRDKQDVGCVIKTFAGIAVVLAICMLDEHFRGENIFVTFAGMAKNQDVRDGWVRSQACFEHSILAGSFGATLLPLFIGLWWQRTARLWAALGVVSAAIIVITSGSSGPILACVAGIIALCFWPLRTRMRTVRWGIVFGLIGLQLVMHHPIWFAISYMRIFGGSTAWDRFNLIDQWIRHFDQWWLLGTKSTTDWGWSMWDIVNEYVEIAVTGGLVTLLLFIALVWRSFQRLGIARRAFQGVRKTELTIWMLGAALVSHLAGFFGVSYFDQTIVSWYALLAMISAATVVAVRKKAHIRVPKLEPRTAPLEIPA